MQGDVLSEGSAQTPYTWHLDSRGGTTDYSATAPRAWFDYFKGKKRISSAPFYTKNAITLPRQARDKKQGKAQKRDAWFDYFKAGIIVSTQQKLLSAQVGWWGYMYHSLAR